MLDRGTKDETDKPGIRFVLEERLISRRILVLGKQELSDVRE